MTIEMRRGMSKKPSIDIYIAGIISLSRQNF